MEKIAIVIDSGSDLNADLAKKFGIEIVPLYINYSDQSYRDVYDISADEVYERLEEEIPTTSVPSVGEVREVYERLIREGYQKILVISISSGLSGMYNTFVLAKEGLEDVEIEVFDTRNVASGAGLFSIYASELRREGKSFSEILNALQEKLKSSRIFVALDSLKYLIKGGRIGKVKASFGEIFNMKIIFSCNDEGIYYTESMNRGTKKNMKKLVEIARREVKACKDYYFVLSKGGEEKMFQAVKEELKEIIDNATLYYEGQIAPTLGVHTGPGLVGLVIFKL